MSLFQNATYLASAHHLHDLPPPGEPEVAFAGRSNAGKSSALNALCGQGKLARVSNTPGRTQLLNFFELPEAGRLVDLPGYGFAKAPRSVRDDWGVLIDGYLASRECLRGLVVVMDARHPLTPFDRMLLDWAAAARMPCHLLLTKADKLASGAKRKTLREVERELPLLHAQASAQLFSAHDGTGIDSARGHLAAWLQ